MKIIPSNYQSRDELREVSRESYIYSNYKRDFLCRNKDYNSSFGYDTDLSVRWTYKKTFIGIWRCHLLFNCYWCSIDSQWERIEIHF